MEFIFNLYRRFFVWPIVQVINFIRWIISFIPQPIRWFCSPGIFVWVPEDWFLLIGISELILIYKYWHIEGFAFYCTALFLLSYVIRGCALIQSLLTSMLMSAFAISLITASHRLFPDYYWPIRIIACLCGVPVFVGTLKLCTDRIKEFEQEILQETPSPNGFQEESIGFDSQIRLIIEQNALRKEQRLPLSVLKDYAIEQGFAEAFYHLEGLGAFREQPSAQAQQAHSSSAEEENLDPYEVLQVKRGATKTEIKKAYFAITKKYHPDFVTHLGKEFRELAHKKMLQIQQAYQQLCA